MQLCLPDGTQQPRLPIPIPSPPRPAGWKDGRTREGDVHKGMLWKEKYRSSVLWWVGHRRAGLFLHLPAVCSVTLGEAVSFL